MYVFQFPSLRLVELEGAGQFLEKTRKWMTEREAEHHILLTLAEGLAASDPQDASNPSRFFTLIEGPQVLAALIATPAMLYMTWASPEMVDVMVKGLQAACVDVKEIYGPGHVAFFMAKSWAGSVGATAEIERADRLYQFARVVHSPPADGRLAPAGPAELPVAIDWMDQMLRETGGPVEDAAAMAHALIDKGHLFMWMQPGPVAMAAFVDPTPHGGSIKYAYVPKALRRNGYGKAVVAALALQVLASGRRFCFVLTDPANHDIDIMLQKVGARTICEFARWRVIP